MLPVRVINPNSSTHVTRAIGEATSALGSLGIPIACETLSEGPPGIESQAQADAIIVPMLDMADTLQSQSSGFVIACFGDPGVHALRERTPLPTLGIQEAAIATAMTLGHRLGVISILPGSVPRHWRSYGAMGVTSRIAGDRALGLGVAGLGNDALPRMVETAKALRDQDGADVLIMGCAGMAWARGPLEEATGLPVVEPCQAAVSMILGRIAIGQSHRIKGPDHD